MKNIILSMLVLTFSGCASTTDPTPGPECPVVTCGWSTEDTCPPDANTFSSESEKIDDGVSTCRLFKAACVVKTAEPVEPVCIPESCKENQFTTCEPT